MVEHWGAPRTALHHTLPPGRLHLYRNSQYSCRVLPRLINLNGPIDYCCHRILSRVICSHSHQDADAGIFYYRYESELSKLAPG